MASWKSVQLSSMLPSEIVTAVQSITSIVQQFVDLEKQAINVAKIYQQKLDGGGGVDVVGTLIQAVVDVVEGALQAGKVQVLFVPITKQIPPEVLSFLPPTLDALTVELGWDLEQPTVPFAAGAATAYAALAGQTGGNAGFFNAFMQSVNDVLDPNRPQYLQQNDAVTMTVLLLGAPAYADAASYASTLGRVFKPPTNSDLAAGTVPTPRNLRAKVITAPNTPGISARLDWDNPPPLFQPPYFPSVVLRVSRYAVIRSTSEDAASAATVLDLFSTQSLTQGMTSDDQAKSSVVVSIGSGLNSTYVDTETLDATIPYYYFVAWEVKVTEEGKTTTLPFDKLSNVCKVKVKTPVPTVGVPPDWMAYGSPLALIPDLQLQVEAMLEKVKALGDRQGGGVKGALSNALDLALANLDRLVAQLDQANAAFSRLGAVFNSALPGIYTTSMTGVGGNAFLVAELARRLQDTSDSGRPPFDDNEYVLGLCIVAGGPRIPDIQPVIDLLASLFQPDKPSNPLLDVLTSLDAVVTAAEQRVFGQSMQPIVVAPDGTVTFPTPLPIPGTDQTVSTIPVTDFDNNTGLPKAPSRPVIGDDGAALGTDDPNNPNAGNTNKTDDSELC